MKKLFVWAVLLVISTVAASGQDWRYGEKRKTVENKHKCTEFYVCTKCNGTGSVMDFYQGITLCPQCSGFTHKCKECGKVQYDPNPTCRVCNGTGRCPMCGGNGGIYDMEINMYSPCPYCKQSGKCSGCNGEGKIKK